MLSEFHTAPHAPCPSRFNLAAYVMSHAEACADKTALSVVSKDDQTDFSYRVLQRAVLGTANGLLQQGLTPGDRVLMRVGNTVEFPIAYLGCIAAGLVPVPTSSMLTEQEVAKLITVVAPKAIIHAPEQALGAVDSPVITTDVLRGFYNLPPATFHMGDANRPAYIIFTSGTSGTPQAVVHAHRAIWARRMMHQGWYGLNAKDRMLHAGAFNWSFTLGAGLLDPWSVGATSLILEPNTDLADLPAILTKHKASLFAAVPGVYRRLLAPSAQLALPHLRHGLSAGEKLSAPLRRAWHDATGTDIHEAYGMSECSTFVSGSPDKPAPKDTLGFPQTGRHIAIVENGTPAPHGTIGQIAIHQDETGLMLGYFNDPDGTAARFAGDWFLTGDLGALQDDGSLAYHGRADDLMNAGGYRVSPLEVETILAQCPGLDQVGVIDVEVKQNVRLIAAFYSAPNTVSASTVEAFAKSHLARYKQPRLFLQLDHLPVNANGKLSRKKLREIYEAQHGTSARQT